jgi:hypothetical protein
MCCGVRGGGGGLEDVSGGVCDGVWVVVVMG